MTPRARTFVYPLVSGHIPIYFSVYTLIGGGWEKQVGKGHSVTSYSLCNIYFWWESWLGPERWLTEDKCSCRETSCWIPTHKVPRRSSSSSSPFFTFGRLWTSFLLLPLASSYWRKEGAREKSMTLLFAVWDDWQLLLLLLFWCKMESIKVLAVASFPYVLCTSCRGGCWCDLSYGVKTMWNLLFTRYICSCYASWRWWWTWLLLLLLLLLLLAKLQFKSVQ